MTSTKNEFSHPDTVLVTAAAKRAVLDMTLNSSTNSDSSITVCKFTYCLFLMSRFISALYHQICRQICLVDIFLVNQVVSISYYNISIILRSLLLRQCNII